MNKNIEAKALILKKIGFKKYLSQLFLRFIDRINKKITEHGF
jgi:hypothetical protein